MEKDAALQCFKELIWEARRLYQGRGKKDEARERYRQAATLARGNGLEAEAGIAEAGLLDVDGRYDEEISLLSALQEMKSLTLSGLTWFFMGGAHHGKGEHDKAIECYKKALEDPSSETRGTAWNNMGLAYGKKGRHDKSIECYEKALADPNYDTPGYAWNNMGFAYGAKGEYDEAIECCQEALKDPNYETPGIAWSLMSFAYYEMSGDCDMAISCSSKAIEFFREANDSAGVALAEAFISSLKLDS